MWHVDAGVTKADPSVGCRESHICPRFCIYAIEDSPAQIASQVFQRLLTPQVADRIATYIDRALLGFVFGTSIIRSTCVGFECMGQYVEARVGRCHRRQRHSIQWVDDSHSGTEVTM